MYKLRRIIALSVFPLIILNSCTLSAPNAKIDAKTDVDQSTQKGTSSNTSDGKSGSNGSGNNGTPQQIVVNVNNNPNINTNVNPNISNSSNNSQNQATNNNANNPSVSSSSSPITGNTNPQTNSDRKYKIVFSQRVNGYGELFSMNSDGSAKTQLTKNKSLRSLGSSGSLDGSKIVYENYFKIFVINSDGSSNTQLTGIGSVTYQDTEPSWSSDNKKIAYIRNSNAGINVWTMNSNGSEQTKITDDISGNSSPKWSTDNKKIAYISENNGKTKLFLMNPDGSSKTELTELVTELTHHYLSWSPDGKQIIFNMKDDIYSINSDGTGGQINLTNSPTKDSSPSYSPDGKKIIFTSLNGKESGIYIMNSDGSNQMPLINEVSNDPAWL